MKYFDEYIKTDNNNIITLQTYNSNVFFNENNKQQIIQTNRNICGDQVIVDQDNKVLDIFDRSKDKIVGILYCNKDTTYNINSKGNKSFLFKPLDRKYGEFIVSTSYKNKEKIYVVIQFLHWKIDAKLPTGNIINLIGPLGIIDNEQEALLYKYNLKQKNIKPVKENLEYHKKQISNIQNKNTQFNAFSIDPIGCLDIDDAFSIQKYVDFFQINVHIADLSTFITDYNMYLNKPSSIYLPDKVINMIDREYSNNIVSLLENTKRNALTAIFYFNYNFEIINIDFKECIINITKNYDYDNADYIINTLDFDKSFKTNIDLLNLHKFSQKIFNQQIDDTHKLVELWMIKANQEVGKKLYNYDKKNTLLRIHSLKDDVFDYTKYIIPENQLLNEHIKLKSYNSAKYVIDSDDINHYGLDIDYYTHFTSPIRRLSDLLIHIQLKCLINKMPLIDISQDTIDKINSFNKRLKSLKFDLDKLSIIQQIQEKQFHICEAYIIAFNKSSINIFIPEFKAEYYINLYNFKLKSLIDTEILDDKIILKYQNHKIELNLFDKLKVRLSALLKEDFLHRKLKIKIIEPCIEFL